MTDGTILIVDDTPANLDVLVETLSAAGFDVAVAMDGESALEQLDYVVPELILLDIMMPGIDGFETCRQIKAREDMKDVSVIFMTALSETEDKVKGFGVGAVDYVTKPFQHEEVLARVNTHLTLRRLQRQLKEANETLEQKVVERTAELGEALDEVEKLKQQLEAENIYLREEIQGEHNFEDLVGGSEAIGKVLTQVDQVASTDATVLILGETGTGKELLARAVHNRSGRKERPLVKVNCAALPSELIESELFGHEKGAFTGAAAQKIGRFELADGGTIFLDEIGDLPLELQAKLLRVLQEGELERLGSAKTLQVDVRVIAATNRDLEEAVREKTFREELFYRLNVFPIQSPPLREREGDIPLLVTFFVNKYSAKIGRSIEAVSKEAMAALQMYPWPGNVRELENVIERAVIVCPGDILEAGDWLPKSHSDVMLSVSGTLDDVQRSHILEVLGLTQWRIRGPDGAARILGVKPTTLEARMKRLGIVRSET